MAGSILERHGGGGEQVGLGIRFCICPTSRVPKNGLNFEVFFHPKKHVKKRPKREPSKNHFSSTSLLGWMSKRYPFWSHFRRAGPDPRDHCFWLQLHIFQWKSPVAGSILAPFWRVHFGRPFCINFWFLSLLGGPKNDGILDPFWRPKLTPKMISKWTP